MMPDSVAWFCRNTARTLLRVMFYFLGFIVPGEDPVLLAALGNQRAPVLESNSPVVRGSLVELPSVHCLPGEDPVLLVAS